jgi:hypothetical protein
MSHTHNVIDIHRPVEFSIDGKTFITTLRIQSAADLLRLADRDPGLFHLAELRVRRLRPVTYADAETVRIRRGACFLSVARPVEEPVWRAR